MLGAITIMAMAAAGAAAAPANDGAERWRLDEPLAAYVENSAGEVLGFDCVGPSCRYVLALYGDCQEGMLFGSIVNSQAGETAATLRCNKNSKGNVLIIGGVDLGPLMSGDKIAFAFPQTDSLIAIARFSLAGASEAIATVMANAKQRGTVSDAAAPK